MRNIFGRAKFISSSFYDKAYSLYDPLPVFRREFTLNCEVNKAKIILQSPGFARCFINGKPITDDLFISAVSNYDKILWYNEYEVSSLLTKGKNTISVIASNGFYNEPFRSAWDYEQSTWRGAPKFIMSLKVNGEVVLVSNESWKVSREVSPIIYSHLRSGEYFDARKKDEGWKFNGYDDSNFDSVVTENPLPYVKFLKTKCPPIREIEQLKPVRILKNGRGYIVDFGFNISGYAEVRVCEHRGQEITMRYAEEIDEQNLPKYAYLFYEVPANNLGYLEGTRHSRFYPESPFQVNKLFASGEVDTFKPSFCYHGFRYLQIEGLSYEPKMEDFTAYFTSHKVKKRANFRSGSTILNFIYDAGIRSTRSNLFWSLTDCPTREKFGWTNDAAASCEQVLINFDSERLFDKWFTDLKADMRKDGSLPGIIPSNGWGDDWGPVCDNLLFELPFKVYIYTGNSKMLTSAIPYFRKYIRFLARKKRENHEFILGDWLGYDSSPLTPKEFVRDFFLIKALRTTLFALKLKEKTDNKLQAMLEKLEREFILTYSLEDGSSSVCSQTALAMMLTGGLCIDKQKVKEQLVSQIIADKYNLTCGMVGVQYLYDALVKCGRADLVIKLLMESKPGYKTWFDAGATTLWECWDGKENGSHNHQMFSNIIAWFFKSLLGINACIDAPAFEKIQLKPNFIKKIKHSEGFINTKYGKICAKWRYRKGEFVYTVTIPKGVTAEYNGVTLLEGKHEFIVPLRVEA